MRGRISVFDVRAGRGKIRGEDGARYFVLRQNIEGPLPAVGDAVTFTPSRGAAVNVTLDREIWAELARRGARMIEAIQLA